jgi:hypothetical protein
VAAGTRGRIRGLLRDRFRPLTSRRTVVTTVLDVSGAGLLVLGALVLWGVGVAILTAAVLCLAASRQLTRSGGG